MDKEKIVVKVYLNRKFITSENFINYTKALDYAKKRSWLGFDCLLLRLVDNKEWVRLWVNSQTI